MIIDYLKALGVTAVELLPIHYFADERLLLDRGLHNYWGYSTLGYFAPNPVSYTHLDVYKRQVYQNINLIQLHDPDLVVVLSLIHI